MPTHIVRPRDVAVAVMVLLGCVTVCLDAVEVRPSAASAAPPAQPVKPPPVMLDPSAGDWVIEPALGNPTAGAYRMLDGPALQAGGVIRPWRAAIADDGTFYVRSSDDGLIQVSPDGQARLLLEADGLVEGPAPLCRAGEPVWNPKEKTLYLTGPNCLRRFVTGGDGKRRVEVVAGVPGKAGRDDGPAKAATMNLMAEPFGNNQGVCDGLFITSKGVVYFSDGGIRKLEDGQVTTVTRDVPGFMHYNEAEDLFYLPSVKDRIRGGATFNPKTGEVKRIVGSPKDTGHYEINHDGAALTEASFNSNFHYCFWDVKRQALWVFGPDENRLRWLKDGAVRTVMDKDKVRLVWLGPIAVDPHGRVLVCGASNKPVVWRLRNTKEGK